MGRWLMFLPPLIFAALAVMFYVGMQKGDEGLPSAFIDREAPGLPPEGLAGRPPLTDADLRAGQVTVVNFWASWCPPCRAEHPELLRMAASGVRVAGVNMMDDPEKATAYLAEEGNPFFAIGFDPQGRHRVNWGVTAPPETFIIRGDGTVAFRFVGPLVGSDFENRFKPALAAALAGS